MEHHGEPSTTSVGIRAGSQYLYSGYGPEMGSSTCDVEYFYRVSNNARVAFLLHGSKVAHVEIIVLFFLLHGFCLVVEVAIKKALGHGRRLRGLPRIIAAPLTVSFVMVTSFWLFFPELLRHNAMDRAFEEYAVMGAFVRDVAKALGLTF